MHALATNIGQSTITSVPLHKPIIPQNFQSIAGPDINLERDLIEPEIALGMEVSSDRRFSVNISTIIISALLFLMILAWFDFIQTTFYSWLSPQSQIELIPPSVKLWYAILITVFVIMLIMLIYYHSDDLK